MSSFRRTILFGAILAVAAATAAAGRWQLRRLQARRANNAVLAAAGQRPPLELPDQLRDGEPIDSGRRVIARGHFDTAGEVLLRGRVQNDGPGLQVVTPFRLDSADTVLWVLRGFVGSPDAVTPPERIPAPTPGTVRISGLALGIPVTRDSGGPLLHNGVTTWKRLDRDVLAIRRPRSFGIYLVLAGDSAGPGQLAIVPPPEWNDGPHLSYAIQWFGMSLAALVFGVIVLWRDGRASPPRREAP